MQEAGHEGTRCRRRGIGSRDSASGFKSDPPAEPLRQSQASLVTPVAATVPQALLAPVPIDLPAPAVHATADTTIAALTGVVRRLCAIAHGADANIPTEKPSDRRRRGDDAEELEEVKDPSWLPPIPVGGPGVWPIHAASGVGYGEGYAANAHRHAPDGWLPAVKYLMEELAADVNARDHNGYNAVHHAAARGDNADALNERWKGSGSVARFIPEFYEYDAMVKYMNEELGVIEPENEGLHDSLWITALMMIVDPASVRYDERVAAGKATINGSSIAPKEKTIELGKKLLEYRVAQTVKAIELARAAASAGGKQRRWDRGEEADGLVLSCWCEGVAMKGPAMLQNALGSWVSRLGPKE
jgi:hypothetical protein